MSPAALSKTVITVDADPVNAITVKLVGVTYKVTPPKSSLAIKLAVQAKVMAEEDPMKVLDVLDEWILKAFGPINAAKLKKRLDDPEDRLDITHLMALMEKVVEASTGDPTSSSSASAK